MILQLASTCQVHLMDFHSEKCHTRHVAMEVVRVVPRICYRPRADAIGTHIDYGCSGLHISSSLHAWLSLFSLNFSSRSFNSRLERRVRALWSQFANLFLELRFGLLQTSFTKTFNLITITTKLVFLSSRIAWMSSITKVPQLFRRPGIQG